MSLHDWFIITAIWLGELLPAALWWASKCPLLESSIILWRFERPILHITAIVVKYTPKIIMSEMSPYLFWRKHANCSAAQTNPMITKVSVSIAKIFKTLPKVLGYLSLTLGIVGAAGLKSERCWSCSKRVWSLSPLSVIEKVLRQRIN